MTKTEVSLVRFDSFAHLLSHFAAESPDAPALRYESETLSFSALYDRVCARAAELKASGKTCLGLLCDGGLDNVIELFAASLAGMQLVMLDSSLDDEILKTLIRYTDVDMLWGDEDACDELSLALMAGVKDGAGKILFFTSGTTERAKAVVLTDHSLCQSAWNGSAKLPLSPEDTLLCLLPLGHVFGFVCGLLWGLSCGGCVALGRGARHYLDDCDFYRPTAVSVVPMLLGFLIRQRCINPELKLVLVGAGDCPAPLLQAAGAMGLRVSFGYGLTETSSGVAISVGHDPYAMDICPDDTITLAEDGEILIQAPTCMMQGYYKRPADTAAVLSDGVFHTGDLGRFDSEGRLHITGRKKDVLVLSDGTKLFLPEYEQQLRHALGVEELAVTLLHGRPTLVLIGEGEEWRILSKLRPLMAQRPRGQQISRIVFLPDALPRTATGKIKRWELQQKLENETP
jgi:long-subunit acyl-CoA synthetase (AMP-forming)